MAILDNIIFHYKLNEASGSRVDETGGTSLTDNNTVTSAAGKIGNAALFVAANSEYLSRVDSAPISTGDIDFTFAGWFYTATPSYQGLIVKSNGSSIYEYELYSGSGDLHWYVENGGSSIDVQATNFGTIPNNTWFFVVCWHDAVNNLAGIAVNAGTANTSAYSGGVADTAQTFYIGADGGGSTFDGMIDSVTMWKRVLTSGERTTLYAAGAGLDYPFGSGQDTPELRVSRMSQMRQLLAQ